jgi:hypothetical protein
MSCRFYWPVSSVPHWPVLGVAQGHVRDFILELGKGFSFLGSQYHLEVGNEDFYLDLLFYHVRLRCYVVIDLKIEDFKPEFAGKMNFYLSAVDDQLRHTDDQPSIGLILCKSRNEMIVEYALRDTQKPMGVSHYRLTAGETLPNNQQRDLPTADELSKEFPLISLLNMRFEIERALSDWARANGFATKRYGFRMLLQKVYNSQLLPPKLATDLMEALGAIRKAAHETDIDAAAAQEAIEVGNRFLAGLRNGPDRSLA